LQLFPNPVLDELSVILKSEITGNLNFQLINIHGQQMQSKSLQVIEGANEVHFDTRDLPAGLYYISLDGLVGKKKSAKFIKVRD